MSAFTLEVSDGVGIITFDLQGEPVNKFNRAVKDEFIALSERIENDDSLTALVLISGKPDIFIAGADIEEFLELNGAAEAERLSREGQLMLDRLERMRTPVVAAIHGACLGGGLEVALACSYRVASDSTKTVFGLPEVQLGLLPGAGGTQRLPRLVGLEQALPMMLEGRNVRAKKAMAIGLVDEIVHPSILREIAIRRAREIGEGKREEGGGGSGGIRRLLLDRNPAGRAIVFKKARQTVMKKTRGRYPAPLAILDVVETGLSEGMQAGLREEARMFGELSATEESKQLIFLFFASTALKKESGVDGDAPEPADVAKIAILGTGFMGAGIASVAAPVGTVIRFKDTDHDRVRKGLASVRSVLNERVKRRRMTPLELENTMSLVGGTVEYSGFANVDLVIEAVFEDLDVKVDVLREVESHLPAHAVVASNTSTIPIAQIAAACERPENVLGMHFFSPVHKMPLLEVIVAPETSAQAIVTAVAYGKKLGKTVITVKDAPGFYVNRILAPYINEAGRLLDEGASVESIDEALVSFGFPVGPITLLDEVGLDIAGKSGRIMLDAYGARMTPSQSLQNVVGAGRLGRKGRSGFYKYDESGKKGEVDASVYELLPTGDTRSEIPVHEIQERTVLAMVNEAARCLDEGIIRSARDGDVGAVFGIGFPPFRGGPFRYADSTGIPRIVDRLEELDGRFPGRFTPADGLIRMARRKGSFYTE
jgi:3-hydroxyacyl-CoA dehydrogenase / enoyl-CoA hydratase / 3-hydroxybutyryl-CoA epimerase